MKSIPEEIEELRPDVVEKSYRPIRFLIAAIIFVALIFSAGVFLIVTRDDGITVKDPADTQIEKIINEE